MTTHHMHSLTFQQGRKAWAPNPINLPSRRFEEGFRDALVVSSTLAGSSSIPDGAGPIPTSDSPQSDAPAGLFHKPTQRAWSPVAKVPALHLDDFPTLAEAANKSQGLHSNNNLHHAGSSQAVSIIPSDESTTKAVLALTGRNSWDEANDDEDLDFLNAEAIEFADGSVVVAAAVAQTTEAGKDAEAEKPAATPQHTTSAHPAANHQTHTNNQQAASRQSEERVPEHGDVDINRSQSTQAHPTSRHSLYQPNQEHGTRHDPHDRTNPTLWQGESSERPFSADRELGCQRRESFGNRDHPREAVRDADNRGEPPRPYVHLTPQQTDESVRPARLTKEQRDAMRKAAERARQRREEEEAQREESKTRARAKVDRLAQTAEETGIAKGLDELEIKEAEESDTKKVEESDAQENEDIGTETAEESEADAFDDTEAAAKEEAQKIEIVEEDQKIEAMEEDQKIEASKEGEGLEAKRRNEEPETGKEEPIALEGLNPRVGKPIREGVIGVGGFSTFYQLMSNAFKRLEADTTKANSSTEKEEREAKDKEERAAEEAARAAQLEKVDQALQQAKLPETVREFGDPRNRPHLVELTEEGRQVAMAKWQALGRRLAKEDVVLGKLADEKRRLEREQEQSTSNGESSSSAAIPTPTLATSTNASTVGPWRRGQPLPKAKSEQPTKSDTTGKKDVSKDKSATSSSQAPASNESRDYHSNKVMHRIDEGYESRENSVPTMEANMRRTGGYVGPTIHTTTPSIEGGEKTGESNNASTAPNSDKGSQEERIRTANASRADRSNGDSPSWRRKYHETASTKEDLATSSQAAKPTPETVKASTVKNGDGRPGRMSRSAATLYRKGNYLAKANGSKGAARISDVPKIHTSLSLQTAGDQHLEPAKKFGIEVQAKQYSEGWDSDASQVETKSAYVAEDWDSDVTQVEEMDVKNDAPVRNQGMNATWKVQLLAQVELLRNEVARHQEEVVSSHERLVQVHAISQINEDRLAEMTATFEEFKKTHHQKIDESAQTITTLETKLVSAEEHAQISASKMVVMQNQVDQERAARRKDKEEIEIKSQALEDIRTEMSAVEYRHSNELRYQSDLTKEAHEKYERELMVHAKDLDALSKLKENHIKQTTELERYKSQAESAASNLKSAETAWESQKSILQRNLSEAEKRCLGLKVQNDNLQRRLKDFSTQALSIQQRASAQVSSAESEEGVSSVEGEGVGKKSIQCQVVELCGVNVYVHHGEEVPGAENITAKHYCIDPAEFQKLKEASDQFKIETAEDATTMTALKTAHESLQDRLEELETKFNKMNTLDVSVGRVSAQHSQSRWAAFPGSNPYRHGGGHPGTMTTPGVGGTGYPTQPCPVMIPPYYPQGYPPMFAFTGGAMAPYGFMPISPVDAHGSLESASQALTAVASETMDPAHQYPHQNPHQHSQHLVGPPPRLPHSAVATPAINSLQY